MDRQICMQIVIIVIIVKEGAFQYQYQIFVQKKRMVKNML